MEDVMEFIVLKREVQFVRVRVDDLPDLVTAEEFVVELLHSSRSSNIARIKENLVSDSIGRGWRSVPIGGGLLLGLRGDQVGPKECQDIFHICYEGSSCFIACLDKRCCGSFKGSWWPKGDTRAVTVVGKEGGHLSGRVHDVIRREFSHGQPSRPVLLCIVCVLANVMLKLSVEDFGLAICFGME